MAIVLPTVLGGEANLVSPGGDERRENDILGMLCQCGKHFDFNHIAIINYYSVIFIVAIVIVSGHSVSVTINYLEVFLYIIDFCVE